MKFNLISTLTLPRNDQALSVSLRSLIRLSLCIHSAGRFARIDCIAHIPQCSLLQLPSRPFPLAFKKIFIIIISVCVHVCVREGCMWVHMPHCMFGDQREIL